MVTAELAVGLPALLFVIAALVWLLALAVGQGMVVQAAREGARVAARGESALEVHTRVHELVPGAEVSVTRRGDLVEVTASAPSPMPFSVLSGLRRELTASATALVEEP